MIKVQPKRRKKTWWTVRPYEPQGLIREILVGSICAGNNAPEVINEAMSTCQRLLTSDIMAKTISVVDTLTWYQWCILLRHRWWILRLLYNKFRKYNISMIITSLSEHEFSMSFFKAWYLLRITHIWHCDSVAASLLQVGWYQLTTVWWSSRKQLICVFSW